MATCTELYIDTSGGLDLDGSTDKNLPYFVVEKLATLPYIHCTYTCRFVDGKVKWPALVVVFQLQERTAHSYFVEILQFCFGITRSKALHIAAQKC